MLINEKETIIDENIKTKNSLEKDIEDFKTKLNSKTQEYNLLKNYYDLQNNNINNLGKQIEELKKVNKDQKNIFDDEELININEKKVNYTELLENLNDKKTTEEMFQSYFQTENNEGGVNNNSFMGSILVSKDDSKVVRDQKEVSDMQEKAINKALKNKKEVESDRTTFEKIDQNKLSQFIKKSVEQLSKHEDKVATFKTNPLLNKEGYTSVSYSPKFSKKKVEISILKESQALEKFNLFYQGYSIESGKELEGDNESSEDLGNDNKVKNQAIKFAKTLEYIISDIIEKDTKVKTEIKEKLKDNFGELLNAVYQHITSGSGININKLSSRLFNKFMQDNPLELSIEQTLKNLRTNLSIDDEGNFCIEQSAYIELMVPVMSNKIGTGLYSKSTVVTKISIDNPKSLVMQGSYTHYLSEATHTIEENKIAKSQESYWSFLKGLVFNTNTS